MGGIISQHFHPYSPTIWSGSLGLNGENGRGSVKNSLVSGMEDYGEMANYGQDDRDLTTFTNNRVYGDTRINLILEYIYFHIFMYPWNKMLTYF